ncbi:MAG: AAA family ATPase [Rhodospirillales bacterium]|nr:AAA family ATPase [Rhodospirillales bacterium]
MPQIREIQSVYWGALRPDPIELVVDGINVATGPNGSGKTTLLDGIKLGLGVDELSGRRPEEYIFDGGGDPSRRAERALIKVVFDNPIRNGKRERLFADTGRGCEASEYVTAICEITRGNRVRYAIAPGYIRWGGDDRSIEEDLRKLRQQIPDKRWMGKRQWSELLARAGVSRELLGVLALKQGETDKVLAGNFRELLRRMLELMGKQETLERFNEAKVRLAAAKADHDQTMQKLEAERRHLQTLEWQSRQHETYVQTKARLERIETVELPLACRAELITDRDRGIRESATLTENLTTTRAALQALDDEIEQLEVEAAAAASRQHELAGENKRAQAELGAAAEAVGIARLELDTAREAIVAAGEPPTEEAAADAERRAADAERAAAQRSAARARIGRELEYLEAGRPAQPPEIDIFRARLAERGIAANLVAETLETAQPIVAEAVLGAHVWTLVVAADTFEAAVALAKEEHYRLPIATAGHEGAAPTGALRKTSGLERASAFLVEIDLPLDKVPGVDWDGLVRGRTWAWLRTQAQPVLGSAAREEAIQERREQLAGIETELAALTKAGSSERTRAARLRAGLVAASRLPDLERALADAQARAQEAAAAAAAATEQLAGVAAQASRLAATLTARTEKRGELRTSEANVERNLRIQEARIVEIDRRLAEMPVPEREEEVAVESVAVLEHERARLAEELADESRFPEEVRSDLVLVHRENQQRTVNEVEQLVEGRRADLEAVEHEVDRAKERYERHIREVVTLLARRFREVCAQAGMEGEIEIVPAETEGEFGIDVKVAHVPGEAKRSYRNKAHSTGQKAKISILLLLAAMGLEGAADLLIMDEHSAHLDSRNIDDVAAAMRALSDRVQFILATPNNEEAKRLHWADHELAFYPRIAGEPFAPPIVLMTRQPEDERRYLEIGQLSIAD